MKEIKLRAWDVKGNQYWGPTEGDWKIELHDGHSPRLFIFDYECEHGSWIEIIDVIFEEYTGLKDKNGREIYEGDVVEYKGLPSWQTTRSDLLVVEWSVVDGAYLFGGIRTDYAVKYGEVVGNIYENPELLEAVE